ncbi:MAG: glycosyltransferase [Candidatus Sumerlaeaceae bacterium]|nr:glycosyltransferase [Candidatus Sumerlaeaceae bacterium]
MTTAPRISIVIPNWDGEAFIARCIAATLTSAHASGHSFELILADDASRDKSPDVIERDFKSVRLIRRASNLGFGENVNSAAREASGDILVLLNNDLVPQHGMIGELVEPLLSDGKVFGVSGKTVDWANQEPNHLNMAARWQNGNMELMFQDSPTLCPTMFVQGGSGAFRRTEFLRLGGFQPIFSPGYWEDYDVSYLALKCGWQNLYNPRAVAHHLGEGSMKRAHGNDYIGMIRRRNYFQFLWLNLTEKKLLREHLGTLPRALAEGLASKGLARLTGKGLLHAMGSISTIALERARRLGLGIRVTDSDILSQFTNHGPVSGTP